MVYALSLSDSNAFYFPPFAMQSDNIRDALLPDNALTYLVQTSYVFWVYISCILISAFS